MGEAGGDGGAAAWYPRGAHHIPAGARHAGWCGEEPVRAQEVPLRGEGEFAGHHFETRQRRNKLDSMGRGERRQAGRGRHAEHRGPAGCAWYASWGLTPQAQLPKSAASMVAATFLDAELEEGCSGAVYL